MATPILIVDDEPQLCRLMQMFLERQGYRVTAAADAQTARQRFEEASEQFRLVVADLSLPDQPGNEMALEMVAKQPDLKVLLCSGYPFSVESLPVEVRERFATLQKPFAPNLLTSAVKDLLER